MGAQADKSTRGVPKEVTEPPSCGNGNIHVPQQYIDIWEHACFLFENADWNSALQAFSLLEPWTTCSHIMTILLLNIGITLCHLGKYSQAQSVLEAAVDLWTTFPIAQFLLGVIRYELGHYTSARIAFMIATLALENADIVTLDHRSVALDFSLTINHLKDNETSSAFAATLADRAGKQYPVLHRLPAGVIFKTPISPLIQAACSTTSASYASDVLAEKLQSRPSQLVRNQSSKPEHTTSSSPISTPSPSQQMSTSLRKHLHSRSRSHSLGDSPQCADETEARPHKHHSFLKRFSRRNSKPNNDSLVVIPEIMVNESAAVPPVPSPSRRMHFMPKRNDMVPREPRTEHVPLHELSSVIRHTGPEYVRKTSTSTVSLPLSRGHFTKFAARHQSRAAAKQAESDNLDDFLGPKNERLGPEYEPSGASANRNSGTHLEAKDVRRHSENVSEYAASFLGKSSPGDDESMRGSVTSRGSRKRVARASWEPREGRASAKDFGDFLSFLKDGRFGRNASATNVEGQVGTPTINYADLEDNRFDSMYDERNRSQSSGSCSPRHIPTPTRGRRTSSVYSRPSDVSYPWEGNVQEQSIAHAASEPEEVARPYSIICQSVSDLVAASPDQEARPLYAATKHARQDSQQRFQQHSRQRSQPTLPKHSRQSSQQSIQQSIRQRSRQSSLTQLPQASTQAARARARTISSTISSNSSTNTVLEKFPGSRMLNSARAKALNMLEGRG